MYVSTRLGRLFYEERGQAKRPGDPAIVLLHGLLFDGGSWRSQVEPLSALGRVLVFDGPGHGKSEPPPRFTLEEHADALFDAFGDLGVSRAVIVGLSWGGMIAMRFAMQHARQTAALALLDTNDDVESLGRRMKFRAFIGMHRRVGIPRALFDAEVAPEMFAEATRRSRTDLVDQSYLRMQGFERRGFARAALAVLVKRTSIVAEIARIVAPTLVICGREDAATPPACSERIARSIAGARLVMIPNAGHMTTLEAPTAVNEVLVPFVARHVRDASR